MFLIIFLFPQLYLERNEGRKKKTRNPFVVIIGLDLIFIAYKETQRNVSISW